jgi:putative FmdB family regulatory protein
MPTYEYACRQCGRHIEVVQRISDEPLSECPHCGGQLRKVFHPAGILLKGSGFYKTDNRQKSTSSAEAASSGSSSKSGDTSSSSSSSSSTDSKSSGSSGSSGSGGSKEKSA